MVVLLALALVAAWFVLEGQAIEVDVAQVITSEFSVEVSGSGKVKASKPVDVHSKNQGIVQTIFVTDGQKVAKGAPLLELDRGPLQTQLLQAEAGLAQAEDALAQANSATANQSGAIDAANAAVSAAQMGVSVALEYKRLADDEVADIKNHIAELRADPKSDPEEIEFMESMLRLAEVGQQEAAAGVAGAEANVAAARSALTQAKSGNPASAASAASAAITAAEDQVELARQALDDAVIKAPVAGIVIFAPTPASAQSEAMGAGTPLSGSVLMEGSAITPGMALFTITNSENMRFVAEISEADIARVSLEQSATVTLDSFAGETFDGVVAKIAKVAQTTMTGGTVFSVEITLDANKDKLAIGMKGDAVIKVSTQEGVVTIPRQALFSEGANDFVYVAGEGRLVKRAVAVGEVTDKNVEIRSGLKVGEEVALASNVSFTDGLRVKAR